MSADIGVFHLLTNQEGNLNRVHMYVYWLHHSRDVAKSLVPKVDTPPLNQSDMSNLEFMTRTNIGQRGILFERVPPTLRGGCAGHRYHRYRAETLPPLGLPRVGRADQLPRVARADRGGVPDALPVELGTCPSRFPIFKGVRPASGVNHVPESSHNTAPLTRSAL